VVAAGSVVSCERVPSGAAARCVAKCVAGAALDASPAANLGSSQGTSSMSDSVHVRSKNGCVGA
jgi:hypothetical protein